MTKHITGKNGSPVSDKATVNFVEGSNITLTVTEDADSVNVQIDGSAGGSGDVATDAIFDAKGDLPVGTGANTAAKLTAGANDTILMADSGEATGLKWVASATPSTQAYGDSAAAGTADTFTRGDHKHAMPAAGVAVINGGLETVNAIGNSGSTKTLAVSTGNVQTVTNSASCTYTMPSGLTSSVGISFTLIVTNNGAFTATFTGVKWAAATAPTLTSGASKVDVFTFTTIDGGTTWYGFVGGQNMS